MPETALTESLAQTLGGVAAVSRDGALLHVCTGWDMGSALALGDALGVRPLSIAELLSVIEAVMVRKLNEELAANGGPGFRR